MKPYKTDKRSNERRITLQLANQIIEIFNALPIEIQQRPDVKSGKALCRRIIANYAE